MPGTYHKMEEHEGGRRHKHRHHSHHKHRHSDSKHGDRPAAATGYSGSGSGHQASTDTSLEIAANMRHGHSYDVESTYKDSLYNPKDSLYGPGTKDSLYSGEDGGGVQHQPRGYHSGSDTRLTSPGRFSPQRHSDRERHAENTFDHVSKSGHNQRRSQEDRIWQDPVSRGAESGQIRPSTDIQHIYLPTNDRDQPKVRKPDPTNLRGYIEPGRPGSGLAAAAALVRGDNYTPEKITTGGKVKVPPPVPQKPGKPGPGAGAGQYNKMGMDELWPGGWDEYSKLTLSIKLVVRVLIANLYLQIFCKVDTMEAL